MGKQLLCIGLAATAGALGGGYISGKVSGMEFTRSWKPETHKAVSFGFTAATSVLAFGLLRSVIK